jgi:serine/threonine protein kinase
MQAGHTLGQRYRLDELIGGGRLGNVWRAHDTLLKRDVAIKVLRTAMGGHDGFRAQFRREAAGVAAIAHPGVVAIHDYSEDRLPDGTLVAFLVMEYVAGRSLTQLLAWDGRLDTERTLRLLGHTAEALHHAHLAGIVHGDVKPENILVRDDDTTVLVDFGIARAHRAATDDGAFMLGAVAYMSPEQLRDEPLSPASDVYSLGVVAYECLTGATPYGAEDPADIVAAHLDQPVPQLPASVPLPVAALVYRAMAKHPGQRFGSASALAVECRRIGTPEPPRQAAGDAPTQQLPIVPAEPSPGLAPPGWPPSAPQETAPPQRTGEPAPDAGDTGTVTAPIMRVAQPPEPVELISARPDHTAMPAQWPPLRDGVGAAEPPSDTAPTSSRRRLFQVLAVVAALVLAVALLGSHVWNVAVPSDTRDETKPSSDTSVSPPQQTGEPTSPDDTASASQPDTPSANSPQPAETSATSSEPAATVTVPSVVGGSKADAQTALAAVGLGVNEERLGDGGKECGVLFQDPEGGTEVAEGTTVTIVVYYVAESDRCVPGQ